MKFKVKRRTRLYNKTFKLHKKMEACFRAANDLAVDITANDAAKAFFSDYAGGLSAIALPDDAEIPPGWSRDGEIKEGWIRVIPMEHDEDSEMARTLMAKLEVVKESEVNALIGYEMVAVEGRLVIAPMLTKQNQELYFEFPDIITSKHYEPHKDLS